MKVEHSYYLYDAVADFGLAMLVTAYAPFLQSLGLSLGEISLLNAIFWLVVVAMEIPTGMFADGKSRTWSLKMGCVFFTLGAISYLFAVGFKTAAIGETLIGIGIAFFSGAEQAWVTDALHREGRDDERRHVFATSGIIRGFVMVVGGFLGSLIPTSHASFIYLPMVFLSPLAFFIVHKYMNGKGEAIQKMTEVQALRSSVDLLKTNRALAWVICVTIVFDAVIAFNHFWSPYFKPIVGKERLSLIWAIIYIGFALSGILVRKISVPQGREATWIIISVVISGVGLACAGLCNGLAFPLSAVIVHEFGRGMFNPLTDSFVHHRVESGYRATFGSLQSLLGRSGLVLFSFLNWLFLRHLPDSSATISIVWFGCGFVIVVGASILYLFRPQHSST